MHIYSLFAVMLLFCGGFVSAQTLKSTNTAQTSVIDFDSLIAESAFTFYGLRPGCSGAVDNGAELGEWPDCSEGERDIPQRDKLEEIGLILEKDIAGGNEFDRERNKSDALAKYKDLLSQKFVIVSRFSRPDYNFSKNSFVWNIAPEKDRGYARTIERAGGGKQHTPTAFERALEGTRCELVNKAVPPKPLILKKEEAEALITETGDYIELTTVFRYIGLESDSDIRKRMQDPAMRALGATAKSALCKGIVYVF